MSHRDFKDPLYEQFARIGHAVASPKRIELLDLLAQGPKSVEQLADGVATPVKNTSAHLRVLRQARLVDTRRDGTHIHYRLADEGVVPLLRALQALAHRRLAEVESVTSLYIVNRDALEPVRLVELRRMMRSGNVTVLDVRPTPEYLDCHVAGALSIPLGELKRRLAEIPKRHQVVAYCRGPYCVFSAEAVVLLRKHGYRARRTDAGLPDWRAEGWPVAQGAGG